MVRRHRRFAEVLIACACGAGCAPQPAQPASPAAACSAEPAPSRGAVVLPSPTASAGACAAALALDWLDAARDLRISEVSSGHFGLWEFHADLRREKDAFVGVAVGTYRQAPGSPTHSASRELRLAAGDVVAMLAALRDAARAPPRVPGAREVFIEDSDRSVAYFVDASLASVQGTERPSQHVEMYVEHAQSHPALWRLRGCDEPFARDASVKVSDHFAALLVGLGRGAIYDAMRSASQADPRPRL